MKLYTLLENTACRPDLTAEHGLSLYLEACGRRLLFDAGQTDAFAHNAARMGVDLARIELAVLSHGHYDHGGGLPTFLQANAHAPVYLSRHAFGRFYNAKGRCIGLDPALAHSDRLVFTDDRHALCPGLTLFSCNDREPSTAVNACGLTKQTDQGLVPDDFLHEHYLLVEEDGKRILISGCSHKGILNLVEWFRPDILIGGFHFKPITDTDFLRQAAYRLRNYPTLYYTGHCTGDEQFAVMKAILGDRLQAITTGQMLCL